MKTKNGSHMNEMTLMHVIDAMTNPSNDGKTQKEIAKSIGIHPATLRNYLTEDVWEHIKKRRLTVVFDGLERVDAAVFAKAIDGDMTAAKLIYARWREQQKEDSVTEGNLIEEAGELDEEIKKLRADIATLEQKYAQAITQESTSRTKESLSA